MKSPGTILRIFSFALVGLLLASASAAAAVDREPKPHLDKVDAPGSPLDLRSATFGQVGTEILMRLTTAGDWEPAQLAAGSGAALCVQLYYGKLPTPRSQVCVIPRREDKPGLVYSRLDPFGTPVESRFVGATIFRASKRSIEAVFDLSVVNLSIGRYSWQAVTTWPCTPADACRDLVPSGGNVIARIRPLSEPRCFGAASRGRPRCFNRALRLAVVPSPEDAVLAPNARCTVIRTRLPYTCQFGVRRAVSERSIALIGDSHAAHWRGALEVVAQARRWRGYSMTRSGCPLSTAEPDYELERRRNCAKWRREVYRWLRRHREVRTVFVSELAGLDVRAPKGQSEYEYQVRGYMRAWNRLPKTVRQIVVLRDTPVTTDEASLCVEQALFAGRRPDLACAISRRRAVRRDPAAVAARRTRSRRVHLFDLNDHMCSRRMCFPVVGGVLVHKDTTHMTPVFAATLGPFVLDRVSKLLGGPSRASFR